METAENVLTEFLNKDWGKKASRFVREGATFKVVLDQKPFSLLKHDQKMEMREVSDLLEKRKQLALDRDKLETKIANLDASLKR